MFDIGFWEISLILVLALVVLGPERLPGAAKKVGYWVGKGRCYIEGVKHEVSKELDASELKRLLHNQSVQLEELKNQVNQTTHGVNDDMQNAFDTDEDEKDKKSSPQYEILEEDDGMDDEVDDEAVGEQHQSVTDKTE